MRLKKRILFCLLSCFLFVALNYFVRLIQLATFKYSFKSLLNTSLALNVNRSTETSIYVRRNCQVGILGKCIKDIGKKSQTNAEVQLRGSAFSEIYEEEDNLHKPNFGSSNIVNENDDYDIKPPTPKGYLEVGKINLENTVQKTLRDLRLSRNNIHAPKKLLQRANALIKNSEFQDFLRKQENRKELERRYCSKQFNTTQEGSRKLQNGLQNIIIDREFSLTFCPIYKAASTSWTANLLKLRGLWNESKQNQKTQMLVQQIFQKVSNIVAPWMSKGTTKFMIVRHPFTRLISCYRDKFENASKLFYYDRFGEKIVRIFRPPQKGVTRNEVFGMLKTVRQLLENEDVISLPDNPYANPVGPTFEEFIKFVVSSNYDDDHWRPFYEHCSVCVMNYDFVLRFENLHSDSRFFIEYLNLSSVLETGWENPTSVGITSRDLVCKYIGKLSMDLMEKLLSKYHHDFELFKYKPDSFLNCIKEHKMSQSHV